MNFLLCTALHACTVYATAILSINQSINLSVCLSVTLMSCIKSAELVIKLLTIYQQPIIIPVFSNQTLWWQNSIGPLNTGRYEKYLAISCKFNVE